MAIAKLYLPKTADNYDETLKHCKEQLGESFGGFTVYDAIGGYKSESNELLEEPVTVVETVSDNIIKLNNEIQPLAKEVKYLTKEDYVMVVIGGDKHLI